MEYASVVRETMVDRYTKVAPPRCRPPLSSPQEAPLFLGHHTGVSPATVTRTTIDVVSMSSSLFVWIHVVYVASVTNSHCLLHPISGQGNLVWRTFCTEDPPC